MYGKIYEQTFTGSMYGSGSHIFSVWSYVIAHTKPDAMVELNPSALASTIGEPVERIEQAIEHFKSPDPKSRSKEFEGRRLIQKGEFIFFVPQYHKYHGFANNKERREYFALKKREQRQRDRNGQTVMSKLSKNVKQSDTESESETDTKKKTEAAKESRPQSDEEFLLSLIQDKTYSGIDVRHEHGKMYQWCAANHKQPTRRRFINWLNRSERPMKPIKSARDKWDIIPQRPSREPTDDELANQRKIVREASEALKTELNR
jgi:hypothetical protein